MKFCIYTYIFYMYTKNYFLFFSNLKESSKIQDKLKAHEILSGRGFSYLRPDDHVRARKCGRFHDALHESRYGIFNFLSRSIFAINLVALLFYPICPSQVSAFCTEHRRKKNRTCSRSCHRCHSTSGFTWRLLS